VLQGTFAALEKVQAIYDFVKQHLAQDREFYLFETPPKKKITEFGKTISQARMSPSAIVHFGWSDQDMTMAVDGPFLAQKSLREHLH